jgi:hypothetical protein
MRDSFNEADCSIIDDSQESSFNYLGKPSFISLNPEYQEININHNQSIK